MYVCVCVCVLQVLDVLGWKMKKGELLLMDEQHTAAQELYR
jgi:hypothetical protein